MDPIEPGLPGFFLSQQLSHPTERFMSSHAFSQIYLHVTFHTKDNRPMIRGEVESRLHDYLRTRALESLGVEVYAVGGDEDHVHLAAKIPPTLLTGNWIGDLKGASSWHINQRVKPKTLMWQDRIWSCQLWETISCRIDRIHQTSEGAPSEGVRRIRERIATEDSVLAACAQSAPGKKQAW